MKLAKNISGSIVSAALLSAIAGAGCAGTGNNAEIHEPNSLSTPDSVPTVAADVKTDREKVLASLNVTREGRNGDESYASCRNVASSTMSEQRLRNSIMLEVGRRFLLQECGSQIRSIIKESCIKGVCTSESVVKEVPIKGSMSGLRSLGFNRIGNEACMVTSIPKVTCVSPEK